MARLDYQQTLDFLFSQLPYYQRDGQAAYKAGLENAFKLDRYFGFPHRQFPVIHVGGTNGKGSVCHMLASVLQSAGYKTGLHTSPHMVDFRERLLVNGQMPDKEFVTLFVNDNLDFFREAKPSFFEMSVFMAFCYFAVCKVDVAIIEVGLGGRLDTTNVVNPMLSVITNIGLEHTSFLGDTLRKIAFEKAGIIKPNTPVVVGERHPETTDLFEQVAAGRGAPLSFAEDFFEVGYAGSTYSGKGSSQVRKALFLVNELVTRRRKTIACRITGSYQAKNLTTLLAAVKVLRESGFRVDDGSLLKGIEHAGEWTGLRGRWEIVRQNPLVICDIAHNPDGVKAMLSGLQYLQYKALHIILGFVADKEVEKIFNLLPPGACYYFTQPELPRAIGYQVLAAMAEKAGIIGEAHADIASAYALALDKSSLGDLILITGSSFLIADFIRKEKCDE